MLEAEAGVADNGTVAENATAPTNGTAPENAIALTNGTAPENGTAPTNGTAAENEPSAEATQAGPESARQLQRAFELAYRHLNRRDRTEAEMRAYLERREVQPEAIEQAVGELLENGYVDDARYARLFAQDKRELERWGAERIRRALRERGIDRELIESTLSGDETESESELERALALLRQRFPTLCWDRRERDRALGMMLRKGYDTEVALDALAAHARSD